MELLTVFRGGWTACGLNTVVANNRRLREGIEKRSFDSNILEVLGGIYEVWRIGVFPVYNSVLCNMAGADISNNLEVMVENRGVEQVNLR